MRFIGSVFRKVQYFSQNEIGRFSASSLITRTKNDITQIKTFLNQCLRIAMLNNPPIPILDEATSSVDTSTDVLISGDYGGNDEGQNIICNCPQAFYN